MASNLVTRIRDEKVEEYHGFEGKKDKQYFGDRNHQQLTVSVGIANYPTTTTIVNFLMNDADQAMYAAKKLGRDRFEVFGANQQP